MNRPGRKAPPKPAHRRSAQQWARLVAAWRESGLDAATFAARRRVTVQRLRWWRWRLGTAARTRADEPTELRLLPLTLVDERTPGTAAPVWEICTPSGHLLRVHHDLGGALLERALAHLSGRS